jgi:hypothetical protein
MVRDPLSERVHLTKPGKAWHGLWGALDAGTARLIGPTTALRLRLR